MSKKTQKASSIMLRNLTKQDLKAIEYAQETLGEKTASKAILCAIKLFEHLNEQESKLFILENEVNVLHKSLTDYVIAKEEIKESVIRHNKRQRESEKGD